MLRTLVLLAGMLCAPAMASAQNINVAWDPSASATAVGYLVRVGVTSGTYTQSFDVGSATTFSYSQALPGTRYYFTVVAYDAQARFGAPSNEVSSKVNVGPSLAQPANQTSAVGMSDYFQLTATDDGDPLTFTAVGLPPGLAINGSTGAISGSPTTAGVYTVTATAADALLTSSKTFTWTVSPRLTVTSLTTSVSSPQVAGTGIGLTAAASGGVAPYQYKYRATLGSTTTVLRTWSTSASYTWTPTQAGSYTIEVWARSAGATVDAAEAAMTRTFVVDPSLGTLVMDSFTGTSTLAAHAPEHNRTGTPWTITGSPAPAVSSGYARVGSGAAHVQGTIDAGVSDVTVRVDYRSGTGPGMGAVAFRLTDTDNHLVLLTFNDTLQLHRKRAGTYTLLASKTIPTIAPNTTHRLEARATGSSIEGWWDGTRYLQVVETFQQTATRHGIDWNPGYDATATYDYFELTTPNPPTPPATPSSPIPASGGTGVSTATWLTWSAARATTYDVNFGTSNPPASAASALTSPTYAPAGLAASTTYYWQIVARNAAGATTGPVWSFTTAAPAAGPTLPGTPTSPSPGNGASGVAASPTLGWAATGATSYDVRFGTSNPPAQVSSAQSAASYSPGALVANTTYYWQIVARNSAGTTSGSVWSFTTAAAPAGVLVSDTFAGTSSLPAHTPDVNATGAPWTVTGATPVPTVASGAARVGVGSGHLQATIDSGSDDFIMATDVRVASTAYLAALAFRLVDANNHLLLVANVDKLQFYAKINGSYMLLSNHSIPVAQAGSTHRLEVRASGSTLQAWWDNAQVSQITSTFQQNATRHGLDWNSAYDAGTIYDNFEIRSHGGSSTAPALPGTPLAVSPGSGTTGVSTTPTLSWTASSATSYDLRFGTSNPPVAVASGITSSSSSVGTLVAGTTYYWQVVARNSAGTRTGPVWSFTTAASASTVIISDTFTGTDGTALSAHAPDVNGTGSAWTITGSTPAPTLRGNTARVAAGAGHMQATLNTGMADARISVDCRVGSSSRYLGGLAFRLIDANNHMLLVAVDGQLQFYRKAAGVYTLLTSQSLGPVVSGGTYSLEVRTIGSRVEGWWNGKLVAVIDSTFQQTATRHGLDWNSAYDATIAFDNFEVRPPQ